MDIQLCSCFVLRGLIHNTQRMLSMYTVPPDHYEGVILLFAPATNPMPSVMSGWQVLIRPLSSEVLGQLIIKYLMWLPMHILRLFRTDNRIQPHLFIHILMNGHRTVTKPFACQINSHAPVSVHAIVLVVNLTDLRLYFRFLSTEIRCFGQL